MAKYMRKIVIIGLILLIGIGTAWAAEKMEVNAPGGGEADLAQNVMKYYSAGNQQVEASWGNSGILQADYLEYYRNQSLLKGKGHIKLIQNNPAPRVLQSGVITASLNNQTYLANQDVVVKYDPETTLLCTDLEWDMKKDLMNATGKPELRYKGWKLNGERIEGHVKQGLFTIYGPVTACDSQNSTLSAGKLIFDRVQDKLYLYDHPVFVRGKNELAAAEIIYDLKTKKLSANGPVKSRIIDENR